MCKSSRRRVETELLRNVKINGETDISRKKVVQWIFHMKIDSMIDESGEIVSI